MASTQSERFTPTAIRSLLSKGDFDPVPLRGKRPDMKEGWEWQKLFGATSEQFDIWKRTWPDAKNTGCLTRRMPTLDIDVTHQEAAEAIEALVRERYEEHGTVLVRIGKPPKRAIPFRTDEFFAGFKLALTAPDGSTHKLEMLSSGQQLVVHGIHPDTNKPYRWHGGKLGKTTRGELPYIREAEARELVDEIAALLVREFSFTVTGTGNGAGNGAGGEPADWQRLVANIISGADFHDSIMRLAASCIARGHTVDETIKLLRGLMDSSTAPHDQRWRQRYKEIPRAVKSACKKFDAQPILIGTAPAQPQQQQTTAAPTGIDQVLAVFRKWLLLTDEAPILAALGAVAANLLPGDPVWLGIIGPPSSAKTEILASLGKLPFVVQAATLSPAGLLSGTPHRQRHAAARGGLLNQIGAFGVLVLKDFGSILQMHPEKKAELLAALREIYDGAWTRVLGSDGGRVLTWSGKLGLLFAATNAIDSHHAVIGSMGDRFLLSRIDRAKSQFKRAVQHKGALTKQMRNEIAEAVAGLFALPLPQPREVTSGEIDQIDEVTELAVHLRGAIERDRRTSDIEMVLGAEGTGRIGLALERLLCGLDVLGVDRARALQIIEATALHSVPPARRHTYEFLRDQRDTMGYQPQKTSQVAKAIRLPTNTARRILEDLTAYDLVERTPGGKKGKADLWTFRP